jgi:septal ring factor EnvC (AmiA/AmiB activator)
MCNVPRTLRPIVSLCACLFLFLQHDLFAAQQQWRGPARPRSASVHAATKPAISTSAYDSEIKSRHAQLDSIKSALEKGRRRVDELKQQEGTQVSQLVQIDSNITTADKYLAALDRRIRDVTGRITLAADSLRAAEARLADRQAKMRARLREMYKAGVFSLTPGQHYLFILFGEGTIADKLYRIRYFNDLNQYDRMLVRQIDRSKTEIAGRKQTLEAQLIELSSLKKEKTHEQDRLVTERDSRRKLIDRIRSEKESYLSMIGQLEEAQKKLNSLIDNLLKQKLAARKKPSPQETEAQAAIKRGRLPWPVTGPVIATFGRVVHPVYQTVTMNKGIDIGAPESTPVKCVMKGRVLYTDWMRGLGRFVIVEHPNGLLTIYAHLGTFNVTKDQNVEQGTVIGDVGKAGPMEEPRIHFEIRRQTEPLDPQEWLE